MYLFSDTEKLCDKPELQRLTQQDPILKVVKNDLRDKTKKLPLGFSRTELTLKDSILLRGHRLVIPTELRPKFLVEIHCGHVAEVKMKTVARKLIWWPEIDKDIEQYSKACYCDIYKDKEPKQPLRPLPFPDKPWG